MSNTPRHFARFGAFVRRRRVESAQPQRPPRLVKAYGLGEGGLPQGDEERFKQIGEQISMLERRAMEAERDTSTAMSPLILADRRANWSNAGSPACSRSASSLRSRTSAATGWCSPRTSARNISAMTKPQSSWLATRAAKPTASASG